jgi:ABC-type sugar transport system ATPase subunit
MTVYDNMAFGLQMRHVPKPEIEERVKKAAEILQITEYLDRKPKALSGGQCQRVALGRAIVRNAKVFLMDEPLSNLDAKLRVQMRSEIVKLHNELGATTIYVTHDQIEAMTMASRIVVMNKGYIQQIGSPKVIYNHPANTFVATFIGSPAMNIIEGTFKKDHIELGDVVSIKVNKETIEAHNNFYKEEIEKANNRIEEIKRTLVLYEESKENKKGEQPAIDIDAINAEVESDPEVIELRNSIAHYEDCLNNKEGHPILFGIRPEDIMEKTSAVLLKNPSDHMKLKVSIAELLGNEYYAHIDFLGKDVIAKVNAELNVEKDQILDLTFNLDKYC